MEIKAYSTLKGAQRATHRNPCPILRILVDGVDHVFIPVSNSTDIMVVDRITGRSVGDTTVQRLIEGDT